MERETDYGYVRDDTVEGVQRVAFMRVVRPNTTKPAETFTANEAHVDIDAEGNIIGITVFMDA